MSRTSGPAPRCSNHNPPDVAAPLVWICELMLVMTISFPLMSLRLVSDRSPVERPSHDRREIRRHVGGGRAATPHTAADQVSLPPMPYAIRYSARSGRDSDERGRREIPRARRARTGRGRSRRHRSTGVSSCRHRCERAAVPHTSTPSPASVDLPMHCDVWLVGDVAGLDAGRSRHEPDRVALPRRVHRNDVRVAVGTNRRQMRPRVSRADSRSDLFEIHVVVPSGFVCRSV